jgi:oligoribonuclease
MQFMGYNLLNLTIQTRYFRHHGAYSMEKEQNLVWIDLEMTGLEPETDTILEIATIITDSSLQILAEGPNIAIYQPQAVLDAMDDWNQQHHGQSGLIRRSLESSYSMQKAEAQTLEFISQFTVQGKSPLCGNSIGQDRRFLYPYMPLLSQWLHYRNIDVSTVKELYSRWYPNREPFAKSDKHEALADIRESIAELKYYQTTVFV